MARLVDYLGDSDMTDEDLTPLTRPSTLSPPLLTTHINPEVPAPAGVDMMGLSGTKSLRNSNSTEPTESLSLTQIVSAPEVNPPPAPKQHKHAKKSIVAYHDVEHSDSEGSSYSPDNSDSNDNSGAPLSQRDTPASVEDHSPLPLNGASTGTDSSAETPRKGVLYSVMFPQEPSGRCSNSLQNKVRQALENNFCFNKEVEQGKVFRNPSIYEKMIEYCGIDEYGTNYPTHLFDPTRWRETGGYENLRKLQKEAYDRNQKARVEAVTRAKIEFVSQKRSTQEETNGDKKKKSKWDLSPNN